jgi:hypothetical protein
MKKIIFLFILFALVASSCKKTTKPNDENEHQAINKVVLTFTLPGGAAQTFLAEDPDGDGGNPPTRVDTIRLMKSQLYTVSFQVFNVVNGVEKNITPTIVAQGRSHEVFFIPSGVAISITKTDRDLSGFPIGVSSTWQTILPANGQVLVKLMHKTGIKGPNDSPDKGHSDLELPMPVRIE